MAEKLRIVARIVAAPGQADGLEDEMKILVDQTRSEPGCRQYDLHREIEDPDSFVFVEEWESRALWQTHLAGDAIQSFNERIGDGRIASGEIMQLTKLA